MIEIVGKPELEQFGLLSCPKILDARIEISDFKRQKTVAWFFRCLFGKKV